jgi:hypothetical protein
MMMMNTTTRMSLCNGAKYPCIIVHWKPDADGHGYKGFASWHDDIGEKEGHVISIRQTQPLGMISIDFDQCNGGAWRFHSFEGTGITERDLQWAMAWAASVKEMWDERHTEILP